MLSYELDLALNQLEFFSAQMFDAVANGQAISGNGLLAINLVRL